MQNEIIG